jgi:SAM-dependent methyltransferase
MENRDYYADRGRLAIYLEIEWSDYLWGQRADFSVPPNPTCDIVPPYYYTALSKFVSDCCAREFQEPIHSFCEVGGGVGRLTFELAKRMGSLDRFCFIEPSENFFEWANRMLVTDEALPPFPVIDSEQVRPAAGRPPVNQKLKKGISFYNTTLEETPATLGSFDLVVSSNVIDRHANPRKFFEALSDHVNPGGILVITSPLDFLDSVTSVENRIADLNELFDMRQWIDVVETELPYSWRKWARPRTWVGFSSQVVAKKRRV